MLPQISVFFINANAPPTNQTKQKTWIRKKQNKYSSTQYIIMLNSFHLKLVKFTKNEQNKKPLQAHHVTTKTGQKKQIKIPNKNCKHTMLRVMYVIYIKLYCF